MVVDVGISRFETHLDHVKREMKARARVRPVHTADLPGIELHGRNEAMTSDKRK